MQQYLDIILARLQAAFDPETLGASAADLFTNLIVGLAVFVVYVLVWIVIRTLLRPALRRGPLDQTSAAFLMTVAKYAILLIGLVSALAAAGINTTSLLASLGIAGFTIGFAAKDAFSNLISGLLIYLDRPFVIGDLVEIEDNYGRVTQITLRSTRIVTVDGKMLAVPNADIINKTVASYTNFPHLRLNIEATVGVEEDLNRVRTVLLQLVENNPDFMSEPPPRVVVTQLNDYNVAVELQVWLENERDHVPKRFELRERVFNALNAAGVEMPYETLQIRPLEVKQLDRPNGTA